MSVEKLREWIEFEKKGLLEECDKHNIPFFLITSSDDFKDVPSFLKDKYLNKVYNDSKVKSQEALVQEIEKLPSASTYLLIDADRTLFPHDSTEILLNDGRLAITFADVVSIFKRRQSYIFDSFLEVAILNTIIPINDYLSIKVEW